MFYITKKGSKTGKRFQKIVEKQDKAFEEVKAFADKYGFQQWRPSIWAAFGGISSCISFDKEPDKKLWGIGADRGEYIPKKNSKAGKAIDQEIKNLTKVSRDELNMCIGFTGAPFKCVGFTWEHEEYFGFTTVEKWGFEVPKDCKEVTTAKFRSMFGPVK